MDQLISTIESILFVANKALSAKDIAKILETDAQQIQQALQSLAESRKDSGVVLLESQDTWQLATNSANSTAVKNYLNAELREKLTDATVETLAIIAYRQPISRAEIEAIRGVNCQYSLRHLLIRGIIQKIPNPNDSRQFLYETTMDFLEQLGIRSITELPEFDALVEKIKLPESQTPLETAEPTTPSTNEPEDNRQAKSSDLPDDNIHNENTAK